jgi:hypothetical protein
LGCNKVVDVQLESEVQMFLRSDLQLRITITQNDVAYVELKKWLDENRGDWQATYDHYPGGTYVKSGNYGIQVTEYKVILYSTLSDEPVAIYIQKISKLS